MGNLSLQAKYFCVKNAAKSTTSINNKEKIKLLADICLGWGSRTRKLQIIHLVNILMKDGYEVEYDFNYMLGLNNEFILYKIIDGEKIVVFSNNENAHSKENAVIGKKLDDDNIDEVIKKLH